MSKFPYTSAVAAILCTVSLACMAGAVDSVELRGSDQGRASKKFFQIAAADSIPVVPPEPEQSTASTPQPKEPMAESPVDDPVAEILRLRDTIRANRDRIESRRSADLERGDEAHRSALSSIAPKDMFETEAEHRKREAREIVEAAVQKAKSESEIHRKYDAVLNEEVEPLYQRAFSLLSRTDIVPEEAIDVQLEKYDPEHGIFIGGLEIHSGLTHTKARIVVPMKREAARIFWKNKNSLVGRIALSLDVFSLDIEIEEFWIEDLELGSKTKERISVLEIRKPSGKLLKRGHGLRTSAATLAKRAQDKSRNTAEIYSWKSTAEGFVAEYNRLVREAKAALTKDPHIQALKELTYMGNEWQAADSVTTAASGLATYLTSFVSSEAFKVAASALAKRAQDKSHNTAERYSWDSTAEGFVAEYNRLVREAKAALTKDPHIQALKELTYMGNEWQAADSVTTAASGLATYLTSFVSSGAFKVATSALAKRARDKSRNTAEIYSWKSTAEGFVAEYNRLVREAKAALTKDPHIQALKELTYMGNEWQAADSVTTAASGLATYLTSFVSSEAFKVAASALAKRAQDKSHNTAERYSWDSTAEGFVAEYNRLVREAKAALTKDPHIQALKELTYMGNEWQAADSVTTAASGLATYLTSFVSSGAFKVAASALAKRAQDKSRNTAEIYSWKSTAEGFVAEYNRLVREAKAVLTEDPHIQALKELTYMGNEWQAADSVAVAAGRFGRAMESVTEPLGSVVVERAEDTANAASPDHAPLDYLAYSSRFSAKTLQLAALLGRRFSPDARDKNDWTDLHWAAALNLPGLASVLLDAGADPNARLKSDKEAFTDDLLGTFAAFGGSLEGDDLDDWARNGQTPLHFAAWFDAERAASHLIANGANVDVQSNAKRTPLYLAAWKNSRIVAELLIGQGATVEVDSREGYTPLDYALYRKAAGTAELIRRHGGPCKRICQ